MAALWLRLRCEARSRWRAWLGLALLVAAFASTAIAAAAGARRTDSLVDRVVARQRPPDIYIVPFFQENGNLLRFDAISAFPEVVESFRLRQILAQESHGREFDLSIAPREIYNPQRQHIVSGRIPREDEPTSGVVSTIGRDRYGWKPGTVVTVQLAGPGSDPRGGDVIPGPTVNVRIVGVAADLGDLSDDAQPGITLSPAFERLYGGRFAAVDILTFRLRRHASDYAAFRRHLRELTGGKPVLAIEAQTLYDQAHRSFHLQATALRTVAAFLMVTALLVLGQVISRFTVIESADNSTLRSIGFLCSQLVGMGIMRAAVIAVTGAVLAAPLALALSAVMPFGQPGLLEPSRGVQYSALIPLGALGLACMIVALAFVPSLRWSRERQHVEAWQPSRIARATERAFPSPALGVGLHMAFGSGRGRSSVPVRSSMSSATLALAALIVALSFSANLGHLLATPRLYGWAWDASVTGDFSPSGTGTKALGAIRGVDAYAVGTTGEGGFIEIGSRVTQAMALQQARGHVDPPLLGGRLPQSAREIAVGAKTLREISARLGDTVDIRLLGGRNQVPFRIVGTVVLPFTGDATALGEGAFVTFDALTRLDPTVAGSPDTALLRFASGTNRGRMLDALRKAFPDGLETARAPLTVIDFRRVKALPYIVLGVVSLLALGTIAHLLWSAVRRRRLDLAILKTIGFTRRQVRGAVACQAGALVVVAAAVGIPAGIALGRWTWKLFASSNGFVGEPIVRAGQIGAVVGCVAVLSQVVAALPARMAAGTRAAVVMRTE